MIPPIARQFIAGEDANSALWNTADARDAGVGTILNLLGEHYDTPEKANADTREYVNLIQDLSYTKQRDDIPHPEDVCLSVKPSQLGGDISADLFESNLDEILGAAHDENVFVWVDMEDSSTTDMTLDAVVASAESYPGSVGVCVQANLMRTPDDISRLSGTGVAVRLVKGAYNEDADVAHQSASTIDDNYRALMHTLFTEFEGDIAFGTHDPEMLSAANQLAAIHDREYQIQMLRGVRESAQYELAAEGHDVWQYAPYGEKWPAYVWRRLREGWKNWKFILRAVMSSE